MAAINSAVGMMDDAYFVGRKVILDWLNDLCQLKLSKIEETASGAVACQVMDALFPNNVPMQKVNWGARTDYEFVANYKVLQSVFQKLKVDKSVEVDRLIRARYQDNLEFMQWLRKFYEMNYSNVVDDYDAVARRNRGKGVNLFKPAMGGAPAKTSSKAPSSGRVSSAAAAPRRGSPTRKAEKENTRELNKSASSTSVSNRRSAGGPESLKKISALESNLQSSEERASSLESQLKELKESGSELKLQVDGLERERDFYFGKLREVEILLQNYKGPDREIVRDVLKVLYATEDDVDGEAALAAAEAAMAEAQQLAKEGDEDEGKNVEDTMVGDQYADEY
mmetsp:Transcript_14948/g.23493  ORF Transcript_14948/g.23493 Transcript_14948/m.23493 type:complete len:338 (+) Transcript_14948:62-1075(+)